ncbi:MAG: hypothetical protein ABSG98_09275 [Anaerolineales bacterium]|jgi:alcohol dehydrogenase
MIDTNAGLLEVARRFGATPVVKNRLGFDAKKMMALTDNRGVHAAIEADGISASRDTCRAIARAVMSPALASIASPSN